MPDIHLPEAWALVAPCGCTDGLTVAVVMGRIRCATAEDAWKQFTPLKRDRDREERQGFHIEARDDLQHIGPDCPHEPKWGIPVGKSADSEVTP